MEQHPRERKKNGTKRLQAGTEQVALSRQRLPTPGLLPPCRPWPRHSPDTDTGAGQGLPQNQPWPVGCQGLPRRRRERLKAKIQLESETLVLHSSRPLKCPVAALENCCSKVYFQHRNKQCVKRDSIPQKWDPCNTNRKLSTVVL